MSWRGSGNLSRSGFTCCLDVEASRRVFYVYEFACFLDVFWTVFDIFSSCFRVVSVAARQAFGLLSSDAVSCRPTCCFLPSDAVSCRPTPFPPSDAVPVLSCRFGRCSCCYCGAVFCCEEDLFADLSRCVCQSVSELI